MQQFYTKSINWDTEYNIDSDITLHVHCRGAAFRICYIAQRLEGSSFVLKQHRDSYRVLYSGDPQIPEIVERLRRPFDSLMTELALNIPTESTKYLHGYLYPLWYILEATSDSYHVQPHFKMALSRQAFMRPGEYINRSIQSHLSPLTSKLHTYSSRQVQVLAHTSRLIPSKVLVKGAVYFFKPWVSGRIHGYYELQSYSKMLAAVEASQLFANARICQLHGLVIDEDDDVLQHYHLDGGEEECPGTRLVGLLLTYIENKGTLEDLAPWSDCTNEDRSRWSKQIHESIECLHAAHVAWGDAKPQNVLIDKEGNACLIDFGGSFTPGWVDKERRETMEGDWQGVQRISEWLINWSNRTVTRTVTRTSRE